MPDLTDIEFRPIPTIEARNDELIETLTGALGLATLDRDSLSDAEMELNTALSGWTPYAQVQIYRSDVEGLLIRAARVKAAAHELVESLRLVLECWENAESAPHFDVTEYIHPEHSRPKAKTPAEVINTDQIGR